MKDFDTYLSFFQDGKSNTIFFLIKQMITNIDKMLKQVANDRFL